MKMKMRMTCAHNQLNVNLISFWNQLSQDKQRRRHLQSFLQVFFFNFFFFCLTTFATRLTLTIISRSSVKLTFFLLSNLFSLTRFLLNSIANTLLLLLSFFLILFFHLNVANNCVVTFSFAIFASCLVQSAKCKGQVLCLFFNSFFFNSFQKFHISIL